MRHVAVYISDKWHKNPLAVPNLLRRKDSFCNECLSLCDVVGVIDRQTTYSSPAGCCIADEQRALPLEVVRPSVGAWVEQFDSSARHVVSARQVRSFLQIAMLATPAEVRWVVVTAVLFGDNVIDMKRQEWLQLVGQPAILTLVVCSFANEIA